MLAKLDLSIFFNGPRNKVVICKAMWSVWQLEKDILMYRYVAVLMPGPLQTIDKKPSEPSKNLMCSRGYSPSRRNQMIPSIFLDCLGVVAFRLGEFLVAKCDITLLFQLVC